MSLKFYFRYLIAILTWFLAKVSVYGGMPGGYSVKGCHTPSDRTIQQRNLPCRGTMTAFTRLKINLQRQAANEANIKRAYRIFSL